MSVKRGLGVPFPALGIRFEQLEEILQIAKQMWSDNNGPYDGKHFNLLETLCNHQAISKPYPPILIGGTGERKTLRLVAKYANACNLFAGMGIDALRNKITVFKQHYENEGRDFTEIEITTLGTPHISPEKMSPATVIKQCEELVKLGIYQAIFNMPNIQDIEPIEIFGRAIIPEVMGF